MKRFKIITAIILTIIFISQDVIAQNQGERNNSKFNRANLNSQNKDKPLFLDNAITIKLKEGVGDFSKQSGSVNFGVQSLNEKVSHFEVYSLEKRFRYNPDLLRQVLPGLSRIYKITFSDNYSVQELVREFSSDPNIEYAEPIPLNYPDDIPDDVLYSQCQHLPQIWAEEAWDIHKGEDGPEIVIAIIDDGAYWKHEDLVENIWQNLGEDVDNDGKTLEFIGGEWVFDPDDMNNIDDDGNGYSDDFIGWDYFMNNNDPDHNAIEDHGTHCAGIAAGTTNNGAGIASISWNVKTMPIQVANGVGSYIGSEDGIIYAAENGADVISNSYGSLFYSQANQEVMDYAQQLGSILVASAGNENMIIDHYPSDYIGVVSVASVSVDDTKASYSSYGPSVDISAPGGGFEGGILSTLPNNNYGYKSGTSMACPLVAGCFGLLKSYHPEWTTEQLIVQVLGSADTINSINPGYEYLLGTGRVNAFRFLDEENVSMPEMLLLELVEVNYDDANGNQIIEQGEEVILNIEFKNFMPFVGDDDVVATLSTEDPDVTIQSGSTSIAIPPEGTFIIEDQFQILVSEEATPHMANFTISFESDLEIIWSQDNAIEILIAPGGVFVFEGEENVTGYSGTYIKEILDQLNIHHVYSNTYPPTLLGFETVFISQSNFGEDLVEGTLFTEAQSLMFQEFLESGGNMYVDMGSMFSFMDNFSFSNAIQMKSLFGVQSNTIHFINNPIDSLYGMPGSVMENIYFTHSDQPHSWYIDDLDVTSNAIEAFSESNFGITSVMNDGASTYGHKTFYLGYSLAEFNDNDPTNSKNNVLLKVLDFFEILPDAYLLSGFLADKHAGPVSMEVQFTDASFSDPEYPILSREWDFDNDGVIDSQEQNPTWTFNDTGEHNITLITTNELFSDTLTKSSFITVNHGYLVYEGKPDGEGYSGMFIRDYMEENGFYGVSYQNELPESMEGYHAAFLSFGNFGSENTVLEDHLANIIINYLETGGYVYLEGGDSFGYDQPTNSELLGLFGLQSVQDGAINPIDLLEGQDDAITTGQTFNSSSQQAFVYIDKYYPMADATSAFEESNYGTVAVQNTGEHNQRTFCFSYALADLDDGDTPDTRAELLNRICNFFDIYTNVYSPVEDKVDLEIYPNPVGSIATFSSEEISSVEIYDMMGALIFRHNGNKIDMSNMPSGVYFVIGLDKNSYPLYKGKIIKK